MAEDFYNKFGTDRKRRKIRTICLFPIFNCLQIWSEFRFFTAPDAFKKGPKTQKRRLQLKFATDFSQISHRVASPQNTQMVIFSKPPKNILTPFLFLFQLYRISTVSSLPYLKFEFIGSFGVKPLVDEIKFVGFCCIAKRRGIPTTCPLRWHKPEN